MTWLRSRLSLAVLNVGLVACSTEAADGRGHEATGGLADTGGVSGSVGASTPTVSGGESAAITGGAPGTGGVPSAGGAPSSGGVTSTGSAPSTGGSPSTGGGLSTGGSLSTGGALNTGGAPSTGGSPVIGPHLSVSAPYLDQTTVFVGDTLTASVTVTNDGTEAMTIDQIVIAGRPPGGTHDGGPFLDLAPVHPAVTLVPGESLTVTASRLITAADPLGRWEIFATYRDASGWHDQASSIVEVAAAETGGTGGASGAGGAAGATGGSAGTEGGAGGAGGGATGPLDPWSLRDRMGRGLNVKAFRLNGAPGWGATYDSRYADVIADAGFDSVRVWAFVQNESGGMRNFGSDPNNTLVPEFFSELDQRVNDFLDRDLVVILNFFELGGFETGSNEYKTIFVNLWTQIAEHYQGYSDRLVFQPINESHDGLDEVLSDWYLAFTEAVRRTNPTRVILYSPPNWGKGSLFDISIPAAAGEYYMGGVHPYEPFCYTHQGWSGCATGIHWTGSEEDRSPVTRLLDTAQRWSDAHDKPVVADEWGAVDGVPSLTERVAWASFVRDECFSRGFAYTYFDFPAGHDWSIYDNGADRWRDEALRDALLGGEAPWD